ncbi:hypothetical protein NEP92_24895, partial [Escherichia coli]|nr:hypothetical protein [Escherichia coli]
FPLWCRNLKETTCWVERTIQMVNYCLISLALTTAELIFSDEGFQVVRGYEHQFGIERRETLFHTLFIGLPSLPEDVWGATQEQTTITLH